MPMSRLVHLTLTLDIRRPHMISMSIIVLRRNTFWIKRLCAPWGHFTEWSTARTTGKCLLVQHSRGCLRCFTYLWLELYFETLQRLFLQLNFNPYITSCLWCLTFWKGQGRGESERVGTGRERVPNSTNLGRSLGWWLPVLRIETAGRNKGIPLFWPRVLTWDLQPAIAELRAK